MNEVVLASIALFVMHTLTTVDAAIEQSADPRNQSVDGYTNGSGDPIRLRLLALLLPWRKVRAAVTWYWGTSAVARLTLLVPGLVVLLTCAPTGLWAQSNAVLRPETAAQATGAPGEESNLDQSVLQQRHPRYRVQSEDVLSLTFPFSPEFNQMIVNVQPDGYINLPSADSVYVKGMTVPEVIQIVKKAYIGTLHEPIIEVNFVQFQKPFFLVSGQVGKPGQYDLPRDITVSEAIAIAGGFVPTAKTQVFLYHRTSTDWVEVKELKLKDILHGKNVNEDAHLSSGDMIFVPEKLIASFRKYVPYSFNAGSYLTPAL